MLQFSLLFTELNQSVTNFTVNYRNLTSLLQTLLLISET